VRRVRIGQNRKTSSQGNERAARCVSLAWLHSSIWRVSPPIDKDFAADAKVGRFLDDPERR